MATLLQAVESFNEITVESEDAVESVVCIRIKMENGYGGVISLLEDLDLGPLVLRANLDHRSSKKPLLRSKHLAYLSDTHPTENVTRLDALLQRLSGDEGTEETAGECVTSTVGVNDFTIFQGVDCEDLGAVRLGRGHQNRRLGPLGNDHSTRA